MSNIPYKDDDVIVPYALIWGWLHLANHRYGTVPTGAMQVIMTIIAMNALGYHPTVSELAEITGLAKSNVSRYVSQQMTDGFLEEYLDVDDRRRRKLRPTAKAERELAWQNERIKKIYEIVLRHHRAGRPIDRTGFESLMKNLKEITEAAAPS